LDGKEKAKKGEPPNRYIAILHGLKPKLREGRGAAQPPCEKRKQLLKGKKTNNQWGCSPRLKGENQRISRTNLLKTPRLPSKQSPTASSPAMVEDAGISKKHEEESAREIRKVEQ